MDQVDEEVGEDDEEWELEEVVPDSWAFSRGIVDSRIAAHFEEEARSSEQSHQGE